MELLQNSRCCAHLNRAKGVYSIHMLHQPSLCTCTYWGFRGSSRHRSFLNMFHALTSPEHVHVAHPLHVYVHTSQTHGRFARYICCIHGLPANLPKFPFTPTSNRAWVFGTTWLHVAASSAAHFSNVAHERRNFSFQCDVLTLGFPTNRGLSETFGSILKRTALVIAAKYGTFMTSINAGFFEAGVFVEFFSLICSCRCFLFLGIQAARRIRAVLVLCTNSFLQASKFIIVVHWYGVNLLILSIVFS